MIPAFIAAQKLAGWNEYLRKHLTEVGVTTRQTSFLDTKGSNSQSAWVKPVDESQQGKYPSTREEHRWNLGRAIESAASNQGGRGADSASVRNHAEVVRSLISEGLIPELDAKHFYASTEGNGVKNIGRNEHAVYFDSKANRVFKITKEGQAGARGNIGDYFRRLADNNDLFDDDLRLEGAFRNPETGDYRILVSQPFINDATPASKEEIATYMRAKKFQRYSDRSWFHPGKEILVSDVEPHNVLSSGGKVFPIDVIPEHPTGNRLEMIESVSQAREANERLNSQSSGHAQA